MELSKDEQAMLDGTHGNAARQSMEIIVALGKIYGAKSLIPVKSVQVAGVSYDNLGDAGLEYLAELARDGKVRVRTTLNPAGMDLKEWRKLGISDEFAGKQLKVISAFAKMGIETTCTCTPYLAGNLPKFGEHVAWSESSAVAYCNSVLGARTNREGGPSALAAAITGRTANYGFHLAENRKPLVTVRLEAKLKDVPDWGALGYCIGNAIKNKVAWIRGPKKASIEELKSFSASIATFGGTALYHIEGITPEKHEAPKDEIVLEQKDIENALKALNDAGDPDFVSLGCPHCTLDEMKQIADYLKGKKVKVEVWIAVSRIVRDQAEKLGYVKTIEDSGAKVAADTCMVVSPLKGRFKCLATDSAKGCFYGRGKNKFAVRMGNFRKCLDAAVSGKWS